LKWKRISYEKRNYHQFYCKRTSNCILEDGKTAELFVETPGKARNVGDIYLGRIAKVMPGIRAAFVDIGMNQDAFLHFSDVGSIEEFNTLFDEDEDKKKKKLRRLHHNRPMAQRL